MANTPLQNDLNIIVRAFVALATGLDRKCVIPGNDNGPAPTVPYASVLDITKQGDGIDSEVARPGSVPEEAKLFVSGRRNIVYSVQFYKDCAADNAESLLQFAATTPGQIFLGENGLTWRRAGEVRNLDSVMGSKFEVRRSVDIEFRFQSKTEIDVLTIGSVEIDLTLSAGSDLTENIEVTEDA
ncbi:MAG: hypothetical protein KAR40_13865 [Candidatus Sabulitectum sp.]|nr:hypothetical protein [Candidatus Sabulitectum sp.]